MKSNFLFQIIGCILLIATIGCGGDDNGSMSTDPCNPEFDQQAFFQQVANNIIVPGYESMQLATSELEIATNDFINQLNEASLIELRNSYAMAYEEWQKVAQFEFGPAKAVFLRNSVNNFPLNEEKVLENIQTGIYDFDMPDRYDKGFPALDFLLYGIGNSNADVVNKYIIGANNEKFRTYLQNVVQDIVMRITQTNSAWQNGYSNEFISNKGTAAGTALSMIINGLNENYELIKREKLGVPSGVLTIGIPNPDRVEAFHSGLSSTLLKTALKATIDLYEGAGGLGLDDYLDAANAKKSDALLSDVIDAQFEAAQDLINTLDLPLDQEINNDVEKVVNAYNAVTRQLVNIKTDMPSVLCVSITYIDNPSDSD